MFKRYPRRTKLLDGTPVTLRPMVKKDERALYDFFQRVPREDRLFLRDDVSKLSTIRAWVDELDYERVLPLLAVADGAVIGDATLHRRPLGWTRHLAKIRIVIDPGFRRKGLGSLLIQELIEVGRGLKLERLVMELMGSQQAALEAFRRFGFERAAVLSRHVKDRAGRPQDLVFMIYDLEGEPELLAF
jgi:ribosomal protein S18 acetylase RimI-like enzyme